MKENELLFEQDLAKLRVIKTTDDKYDIEVAVLDGPSIGITEPNEFIAKTITQGLIKAYTVELAEMQAEMREALSNLQESAKEDEPSKLESK